MLTAVVTSASLFLPLALFVTSQLTFPEPRQCRSRSERCVLLSTCLDRNITGKPICDFRGKDPMVCCSSVRQAPAVANRSTTKVPLITSTAPLSTPKPRTRDLLPQDCGRIPSLLFKRIIGGETAEAEMWPWLVLLYSVDEDDPMCGGSIISKSWVLTASHCVFLDSAAQRVFKPGQLRVRQGATNLTSKATFYTVSRVYPHPGYVGESTYANDIALLRLGKEVKLGDLVKPICLPGRKNDLGDPTRQDMTGRMAFVAGWGKTNQDARRGSNVLLQTQLPIWSDSECHPLFRKIFSITSTSFCAGTKDSAKDACRGDSGGPLMLPGNKDFQDRFYCVGIVSFGRGCGTPDYPGGYTNMTLYRSWIEETMESDF